MRGDRHTEFNSRITGDLHFLAMNSTATNVTINDSDAEWSFRKHHPHIENRPYHGDRVRVDRSVLSARMRVNAGELYTHDVLRDNRGNVTQCEIQEWTGPGPGTPTVHRVTLSAITGLNIKCRQPGGILILDSASSQTSWLPVLPGVSYEITIDSDCAQAGIPPYASDFRLYYTSGLIAGNDRKKFDFLEVSKKQKKPRSPRICERAILSKTDSLGLPIFTYEQLKKKAEKATKEREERKRQR